MKNVRDRINDLSEDMASGLSKALRSFDCYSVNDLDCNKCPLCQSGGICLYDLVDDRVKYGKC